MGSVGLETSQWLPAEFEIESQPGVGAVDADDRAIPTLCEGGVVLPGRREPVDELWGGGERAVMIRCAAAVTAHMSACNELMISPSRPLSSHHRSQHSPKLLRRCSRQRQLHQIPASSTRTSVQSSVIDTGVEAVDVLSWSAPVLGWWNGTFSSVRTRPKGQRVGIDV
jgi:hypothetical protein